MNIQNDQEVVLQERLIQINRVVKKTKGGNNFKFAALVAVGNMNGRVGLGMGKAPDVKAAIVKAVRQAKRNMIDIKLQNGTIPHSVNFKKGQTQLMLKPAPAGTGLMAGGAVRPIVELAGIRDISTKIMGSSNNINNAYGTMEALNGMTVVMEGK